ncbi:MAG TPA: isoprenylcysteine carboxylmethyltransferase family protein [Gammaproteobacteria bacterium]|nr:isoprenylcysteine carboxylmethyltransferase family protein [Gammaproteobacteria bacterium]
MQFIRHLLSILLLPGMAAGVMPWWLLHSCAGLDSRWPDVPAAWMARIVGALVLAAGLGLFGWCVLLFARVGQGTLAPWDPTRKLVAVGPYRHVRNPMISGVALVLAGLGLIMGSWLVAAWAGAFFCINHAYFLLSEEPGLEGRFGGSYREYKAAVPRWLPMLKPWSGGVP